MKALYTRIFTDYCDAFNMTCLGGQVPHDIIDVPRYPPHNRSGELHL